MKNKKPKFKPFDRKREEEEDRDEFKRSIFASQAENGDFDDVDLGKPETSFGLKIHDGDPTDPGNAVDFVYPDDEDWS